MQAFSSILLVLYFVACATGDTRLRGVSRGSDLAHAWVSGLGDGAFEWQSASVSEQAIHCFVSGADRSKLSQLAEGALTAEEYDTVVQLADMLHAYRNANARSLLSEPVDGIAVWATGRSIDTACGQLWQITLSRINLSEHTLVIRRRIHLPTLGSLRDDELQVANNTGERVQPVGAPVTPEEWERLPSIAYDENRVLNSVCLRPGESYSTRIEAKVMTDGTGTHLFIGDVHFHLDEERPFLLFDICGWSASTCPSFHFESRPWEGRITLELQLTG